MICSGKPDEDRAASGVALILKQKLPKHIAPNALVTDRILTFRMGAGCSDGKCNR
jgi:hypothetical protein